MAGKFTMRGGDKLKKALRALPKEMQAGVKARVKAEATALAEQVKARAPVDTGALKGAIKVRTSQGGLRARVGVFEMKDTRIAGAAAGLIAKHGLGKSRALRVASALGGGPIYARWVEFGTTKMAARPYLFPTFKEKRRAILAGIATAARDAIKKANA